MAEATKQPIMTSRILKFAIPAIVGIIIAFIPAPEGLTTSGMVYIGTFLCVIAWMILKAMPDFIAILVGLAALLLAGCGDWYTVMQQFSGSTMWTVVAVFAIASAVKRSGLLDRVALMILSKFPGSYNGQLAGILTTGLVLSPMIPSTTAKASILTPFAQTIGKAYGWKKNDKPLTGLFCTIYMITQVLGLAFLSGGVVTYVIVGFLPDDYKAYWSWTNWIVALIPWLIVGVVLTFVAAKVLYGPKKGEAAGGIENPIRAQRERLGKMTGEEKVALGFLLVAFLGWTIGSTFGLDAGVWSIIIMGVMVAVGFFTSEEFLKNIPWATIFFIGGIFSLAGMISTTGVSTWLAALIAPYLAPIVSNPYIFVVALCLITYVVRLLIVSQSATVTIFVAGLMTVCIGAGINPWVMVFVVYLACFVWHFEFTSVQYIANMALTNGEMCDHKATVPFNIAFMIIHIVACCVSVPWWQMLGLL